MVTVLRWGLATIDSLAFMMTSDNSQLDLDNKWLSLAGLCWQVPFLKLRLGDNWHLDFYYDNWLCSAELRIFRVGTFPSTCLSLFFGSTHLSLCIGGFQLVACLTITWIRLLGGLPKECSIHPHFLLLDTLNMILFVQQFFIGIPPDSLVREAMHQKRKQIMEMFKKQWTTHQSLAPHCMLCFQVIRVQSRERQACCCFYRMFVFVLFFGLFFDGLTNKHTLVLKHSLLFTAY